MSALRPGVPRQAGATLIELVLTVAVLGIAVLVAIPRTDPAASVATDALAGDIANALRFGQQEAIRTGRYHVVQIDSAGRTLEVYRLSSSGGIRRDGDFTVLHPVDRRAYLIRFTNTSWSNATTVGSLFKYSSGTTKDYVCFGPDGVPAYIYGNWNTGTPSNRELLAGDGVVTVRHGQAERQVRLDPVTGRVTY